MKRTVSLLALGALLATGLRPPAAFAAPALSPIEIEELDASYQHLSAEFYKKVDAQILLDGAHAQLVSYLRKNGIASPAVPAIRAGDDTSTNMRVLDRAVGNVVATYGAKFGSRAITYQAITGLMASVKDKYTVFLTPKEYAALNEGLDGGNFSGVGIAIDIDSPTKYLRVNEVIEGGPAEKAGLQPGDLITAIDGKSTKGLSTDDDAKQLRGKQGTVVRLTIERSGAALPNPVAVTRAVIHQPSVYAKLLPGDIGYTRLTVFGANTASELSKALDKLDAEGAKAYVLDLRDNGGGYLSAAVDVASKFVPSGPIVSVEDRVGGDTEFDAENTAIKPRPLAVLVNKYTASASEITSGAIQDDAVGTVIGTRTYGKGVVQTIYPLPDGAAVKITTARYLTPHGRDINSVGIQPDIIAEETNKTAKLGEPSSDTQLQAAIAFLQNKLAQQQQQQAKPPQTVEKTGD